MKKLLISCCFLFTTAMVCFSFESPCPECPGGESYCCEVVTHRWPNGSVTTETYYQVCGPEE